ncbi:MAG: hypothetical protein KME07_09155 [Pegethrix bostrychoides GSE-TBD4-15B]|jgi:hypothetical protein|uniref:Uncharacterized protein n=1 Tax=Pegethrix bostrychoides GSE-TBD4-15B TaxID=2839662 RepID=A0A951PA10_9CYAN|nr:hypothetical protein [Pegethrix bostrychoides GSE-TBD4-15B]
MQFSRSFANCFSRYSQDTVPAGQSAGQSAGWIEADLTEPRQIGCDSIQSYPSYVRHSMPMLELRCRSESCRSAVQTTKLASRFVLPIVSATEYENAHQRHIQRRLQHRIAVATARGDQSLVQLLQREMQRAG